MNGRKMSKITKRKISRMTYGKCLLAILLLLVGAVLGPQLLFELQDKHTQENIWLGERSSVDITVLNAGYTKVLRNRMMNFAEGIAEGKQYYVAATDCKVDEECYSILENALKYEWVTFLDDVKLIPNLLENLFSKGFSVDVWKRYVIYDENFENGVAFMAWYFEIDSMDGLQIKLLSDAEDDTLYYVQFVETKQCYDDSDWYDYGWYEVDAEFLTEVIPLYWFFYYEAGIKEIGSYEEYCKNVRDDSNGIYTTNEQKNDEKDLMKEYEEALINNGSMHDFPYGDKELQWEIKMTEGSLSEVHSISMGMKEIVDLIPEFKEN